jgi:hypothetical protein
MTLGLDGNKSNDDSARRGQRQCSSRNGEQRIHLKRNIERYVSNLDLARGGSEGRRGRKQPAARRFLVVARLSDEGGWEEILAVMPC